ncbi:tetratricopeptide repeat protein [Ureibacillus sinduriensis]|uniref:Uncharacterized protein n=1 Tax=Ureibacillus sinduriensis BLB-1 = JCM 15800 TaxID=1384057 RepID=A0A0A3I1E9_9BACL|nr:hypothetical protein [Ureibacillus sinduriensis]KGR76483.1 hypothetical protein CD33_06330 [Ureibacillus sinduriensis BLB-1 = JCM 15800]
MNNLLSVFNNIEKLFVVKKWKYFGIELWPLFRKQIEKEIVGGNFTKINPKEFNSIDNLISNSDEYDNLFLFDPIRLIEGEDGLENRILGPYMNLINSNKESYVNIQYSVYPTDKIIRNSSSYFLDEKKYIAQYLYLAPYIQLEEYEDVKEYFEENVGILNFPSMNEIYKLASEIYALSKVFEKILVQKKIKRIFVEIYYHKVCLAATLAAHNVGIPSIEVQHGILKDTLWYGWNLKNRNNGFTIFPNIYLTWNEFTTNSINQWANKTVKHKAIMTGNLWVENYKKNREYELSNSKTNNKENILVTLQPIRATPEWNGNIPNWFLEFIKETADIYKFYIRFHPIMEEEERNSFIKKVNEANIHNISFEEANNNSLLSLFSNTFVNITPYSSTAFEAYEFGVPTIFIHYKGNIIKNSGIPDEYIFFAEDKHDLRKIISSSLSIQRTYKNNSTKDVYSDNIISLIDTEYQKLKTIESTEQGIISLNQFINLLRRGATLNHYNFSNVLDVLFNKKEYELILNFKDKFPINKMDYFFFAGRSFFELKDINGCIEYLKEYLDLYESRDNHQNNDELTIKKNYLLSALYYMGLSQFFLGNLKESEYYFKECITESNGNHKGASKYIEIIKSN